MGVSALVSHAKGAKHKELTLIVQCRAYILQKKGKVMTIALHVVAVVVAVELIPCCLPLLFHMQKSIGF